MCSLGLGHGLPDALRQLLATWDVNVTASCEKFLERLIAADQQDLASRNKLKLLRICRNLCGPSDVKEIALQLTTHRTVDRLMYSILGHKDRERATLRELADPKESPVLHCIGELALMLSESVSYTHLTLPTTVSV